MGASKESFYVLFWTATLISESDDSATSKPLYEVPYNGLDVAES